MRTSTVLAFVALAATVATGKPELEASYGLSVCVGLYGDSANPLRANVRPMITSDPNQPHMVCRAQTTDVLPSQTLPAFVLAGQANLISTAQSAGLTSLVSAVQVTIQGMAHCTCRYCRVLVTERLVTPYAECFKTGCQRPGTRAASQELLWMYASSYIRPA